MNMFLKSLLVLSVLAMTSCTSTASKPARSNPSLASQIPEFVLSYKLKYTAYNAVTSGCIYAGMQNQQLAQALVESHGKVCQKIVDTIAMNEIEGRGTCPLQDEKCMFMVGYVYVYMQSGNQIVSNDELNTLAETINSEYAKSKKSGN